MTMPTRLAAAAVIGVIAVGSAFFLTRPDQPAVGGPSPDPRESMIATAQASPSTAVSRATAIQLRPPTWTGTGNLLEGRYGETATLLSDGRVLVVGGVESNGDPQKTLATAEVYDPGTGVWTATGSMATARTGHGATLLSDGRVLVEGGQGAGEPATNLLSAELYDPHTGIWTATGSMVTPAGHGTLTLLPDGKVLGVGGGRSGPDASAELFDPRTGAWTTIGSMATRRAGHTATLLLDGRVLVVGGAYSGPVTLAELYDPKTGTWSPSGQMSIQRSGHTSTLLPGGRVLVAGAAAGPNMPSATAELFDPSTGSWSTTGSMVVPRHSAHAVLLPDGRVLVAGGRTAHQAELCSAELYDPSTGSWSATVDMLRSGGSGTATLLRDGRVLFEGGRDLATAVTILAELYDPGTGN